MYYFRDRYFDQQVAFGAYRAPIQHPCAAKRRGRRTPRAQGSALGLLAPFVCVGVTFCFGLMVMDVLGLEHLVIVPSVDGITPLVDHARVLVCDLVGLLPDLSIG